MFSVYRARTGAVLYSLHLIRGHCRVNPLRVCAVWSRSQGHHFFTIGQRAKLGGRANAWFVAGKDPQNNTITVVCSIPEMGMILVVM